MTAKTKPTTAKAAAKTVAAQAKAVAKQIRTVASAPVANPANGKPAPAKRNKTVKEVATSGTPINGNARIVVLPAGKENPRREGSARWRRYRDLINSKTVGDFLAKHPKWHATVTRCVAAKLIELR